METKSKRRGASSQLTSKERRILAITKRIDKEAQRIRDGLPPWYYRHGWVSVAEAAKRLGWKVEEIETLINGDRQAWIDFAHGLHDAAVPALKAIDTKNADGLFDAGGKIDTACENCHLRYWYPPSKQAAATRKP